MEIEYKTDWINSMISTLMKLKLSKTVVQRKILALTFQPQPKRERNACKRNFNDGKVQHFPSFC